MIRLVAVFIAALFLAQVMLPSVSFVPATIAEKKDPALMAELVKQEFLHAWKGYEQYAWGADELRPLTKKPYNWHQDSLAMTPVDALDTLLIMGLKDEANKTREYIVHNLNLDADVMVSCLETNIRLLGGLLSSYELTHDRRLLALAEDLGMRLLPAFDSPTGIPYRYVNLQNGAVFDENTNPSEAGTFLLEFGTLSRLTGEPIFYERAKRAVVEIFKRRSPIGLVGQSINVETGKWTREQSYIGGGIDSYYEYLLKGWLLFGDRDCKEMWLESIKAINTYLADETWSGLWYKQVDMVTGKRIGSSFGALDAFFPAVLALSGDLNRAERLQASCFRIWMTFGIEPERIDYRSMWIDHDGYALRPEIVESTYYLYHFTKNPFYQNRGAKMFESFMAYCRTEAGYASLRSVVTKEQIDEMPSYLFAETFKYFYLLFAPEKTLDFDKVIFNTEAHPLKRFRVEPPPAGAGGSHDASFPTPSRRQPA